VSFYIDCLVTGIITIIAFIGLLARMNANMDAHSFSGVRVIVTGKTYKSIRPVYPGHDWTHFTMLNNEFSVVHQWQSTKPANKI
jgi:hypothetical protein